MHLYCGAIAAIELLQRIQVEVEIYLHGGAFSFPYSFKEKTLSIEECRPCQEKSDEEHADYLQGTVVLKFGSSAHSGTFMVLPRLQCPVVDAKGFLSLSKSVLQHAEAESSFVVTFFNQHISSS